ncbi:MAG: hypothetical protein U9R66_08935, partial [Thermodesulfobacteriota bacterium]|nr:hypothetical protein [Thermodesulfobacteriota bacterium]
ARKGGFGSAVLELFEQRKITGVQIRLLGIPDQFIEHGGQTILRKLTKIDTAAITSAALEMIDR